METMTDEKTIIRITVIMNHLKHTINPALNNIEYQSWLKINQQIQHIKFRDWVIQRANENIIKELSKTPTKVKE